MNKKLQITLSITLILILGFSFYFFSTNQQSDKTIEKKETTSESSTKPTKDKLAGTILKSIALKEEDTKKVSVSTQVTSEDTIVRILNERDIPKHLEEQALFEDTIKIMKNAFSDEKVKVLHVEWHVPTKVEGENIYSRNLLTIRMTKEAFQKETIEKLTLEKLQSISAIYTYIPEEVKPNEISIENKESKS